MSLYIPKHDKRTPRLINNTVSNGDEISRWVLDRAGIEYVDERHAPGLHIRPSNRAAGEGDGIANNPVFVASDALAYGKDGVFRYVEERCAPSLRLLPSDDARRHDAEVLYKRFLAGLWRPVGRLIYMHLLPERAFTVPLVTRGVPFWESLVWRVLYSVMARLIARGLELEAQSEEELAAQIDAECREVEDRLADGRRYLTGDTFTIADLCFAVTTAPLALPPEFRGSIAGSEEELPPKLRPHVARFRERPAGKFVLRMFRDHRPPLCDQEALPPEHGALKRLWLRIRGVFLSPRMVSRGLWLGQRWTPTLRLGKRVLVNRHASVVDVLRRDEDFTIEPINGPKMDRLFVRIFLGMDRSPQHDREQALMRGVVRKDDLERIRGLVRDEADALLRVQGRFARVDVPVTLVEPVMTRLIVDYFGVPAPTERQMRRWMYCCFYELFLNHSDDEDVAEKGLSAAQELRSHIEQVLVSRRAQLGRGEALADNLVNRLLMGQASDDDGAPDDDTIRRNISGAIIGALATTSTATVLVLDELLRRPEVLEGARAAAMDGEMERLRGYVFEALRFNPQALSLLRHSPREQFIEVEGKKKPRRVPAGSKVFAAVGPAMLDPRAFPKPLDFDPEREGEYMLFGYGYHECLGKHINAVTLTELVAAVLRLPNLRRARGLIGGPGLYGGPFPRSFLVLFDRR